MPPWLLRLFQERQPQMGEGGMWVAVRKVLSTGATAGQAQYSRVLQVNVSLSAQQSQASSGCGRVIDIPQFSKCIILAEGGE